MFDFTLGKCVFETVNVSLQTSDQLVSIVECVGMILRNLSRLDQHRWVWKDFCSMWDLLLNSEDFMFHKIQI